MKKVSSSLVLTKHVNAYKIPITLPYWQPFILASILGYNTTNHLDLPLDNFKEDISPEKSNNGKEKIRVADINSNKEDIRPADINK